MKFNTFGVIIWISLHYQCESGFLAKLMHLKSVERQREKESWADKSLDNLKWETQFPYADLIVVEKFQSHHNLKNGQLKEGIPSSKTGPQDGEDVCRLIHDHLKNNQKFVEIVKYKFDCTPKLRHVKIKLPSKNNWNVPNDKPRNHTTLINEPHRLNYDTYDWKFQKMSCAIHFECAKIVKFYIVEGPAEAMHTFGYFILLQKYKNILSPLPKKLYLVDYVYYYFKNGKEILVADWDHEVHYLPDVTPITRLVASEKAKLHEESTSNPENSVQNLTNEWKLERSETPVPWRNQTKSDSTSETKITNASRKDKHLHSGRRAPSSMKVRQPQT